MVKHPQHIEIVRSDIKGLSSMSRESRDSLIAALSASFSRVGETVINRQSDLRKIDQKSPDLVFLGMEYVPSGGPLHLSRRIWLGDYLDSRGIAYTGSTKRGIRLSRHKDLAKRRMAEAGINTPGFSVIKLSHKYSERDISRSYPLFVKPLNGGGGFGVDSRSLAHNFSQLQSKVEYIFSRLNHDALIEEYLPGREFSVAILKDDVSGEYQALPIELLAPADENGTRILSGKVKSANAETARAVEEPALRVKVSELALAAFEALGARDYGRIDIRLDAAGNAHFLEANLIPSLISGYGSYPKACEINLGMGYEAMVTAIAGLALEREPARLGHLVLPPAILATPEVVVD